MVNSVDYSWKDSNSILDLFAAKREGGKIYNILNDSKMSTSPYFNYNFQLKYWIAIKLAALDR